MNDDMRDWILDSAVKVMKDIIPHKSDADNEALARFLIDEGIKSLMRAALK